MSWINQRFLTSLTFSCWWFKSFKPTQTYAPTSSHLTFSLHKRNRKYTSSKPERWEYLPPTTQLYFSASSSAVQYTSTLLQYTSSVADTDEMRMQEYSGTIAGILLPSGWDLKISLLKPDVPPAHLSCCRVLLTDRPPALLTALWFSQFWEYEKMLLCLGRPLWRLYEWRCVCAQLAVVLVPRE